MHKRCFLAALVAAVAVVCPADATLTSTSNTVTYTGNAVTTSFTVPFKFLASTDLVVTVAGATKTLNSDYTVTGAGNATGTVKFTVAPANLASVVITRTVDYTQRTSLAQNRTPDPRSVESALDKLAMGLQQIDAARAALAAKEAADVAAAINPTPVTVNSNSLILATGSTTSRTLAAIGADLKNVKGEGALGDGTTDDTAAIQSAINKLSAGTVLIPPATYVVTTLTMKSGVWIALGGATLKMKAGAAIGAKMFDFTGVSNSGLLGSFTIDGNRANQTNVWNSGQFGVFIGPGASDLFIQSGYATGFSEDSMYIGGAGTTPRRIVVDRWVADQCYRNGVSITNAQDVYFGYLEGRSTNGNDPQAGLDIETNTAADVLTNIHLGHLNVHDNSGRGAQFLGVVSGTTLVHGNVTVDRLDSYSNLLGGVLVYKMRHISILNGAIYSNTGFGIEITRDVQLLRINAHVFNNTSRGISGVLTTQTVTSSDWDFSGTVARNNSQAAANTQDGIRLDSDDAAKVLTRVRGDGVALYDDQGTPTQRYGLSTGANTSAVDVAAYMAGNATGSYTLNGTGYVETQRLFVSAVLTYTAIPAAFYQVQSATVTGAAVGDQVYLSPSTALTDGLVFSGFVSASNTVKVTIGNFTTGSLTPGAITFKITVVKH